MTLSPLGESTGISSPRPAGPRDRAECGSREPGQHRPRTCVPAAGTGTGVPNRRCRKRPRLLSPGQSTWPGGAHPRARGHRGGRTALPKNTPGHFLRRGRGRKGLSSNLETRRSGLHPALLFLLLLSERGHGPLHPRGGCHGLGAPRTPSLPAGTAGHPAPFPGPRHPWAPRTFPGALCALPWAFRILSRGTRSRSPAQSTLASFPRAPAPPGTPRPFPGYPAFPPEPGASVPPYTRTPTPVQGTPLSSRGTRGHRTPGPADDGGVAGPRSTRCPRGAEPRMGRCGGARPGHPTGEGERGATAGRAGRGVTRGLT